MSLVKKTALELEQEKMIKQLKVMIVNLQKQVHQGTLHLKREKYDHAHTKRQLEEFKRQLTELKQRIKYG